MCEAPRIKNGDSWMWLVIAAAMVAGFGMGAMAQEAVVPEKPAAVVHKLDKATDVVPTQTQPNLKNAVGDENAILLQMARELKTKVDKTDENVLSLDVIRQAQEIEQFARKAEREMAASRAPSGK